MSVKKNVQLNSVCFFLFFCYLGLVHSQTDNFKIQEAKQYFTEKYNNYDIVILGEHHGRKEEVSFLKEILPLAYEKGVRAFAFEFLVYTVQSKIDSLMSLEQFNHSLVDSIIQEQPFWFVREYMDILYALWELNRIKPESIRIIAAEAPEHLYSVRDRDSVMADNILLDYEKYRNKILVYCGTAHGFTKFYQMKPNQAPVIRLGNILYNKYLEKVTNVTFFPIFFFTFDEKGMPTQCTSFSYVIRKNKCFGFDLQNSPIASLTYGDYYLRNNPTYNLGNFYDGAVFLNKRVKICTTHPNLGQSDRENYKIVEKLMQKRKRIRYRSKAL
jgi:hypothetical protein